MMIRNNYLINFSFVVYVDIMCIYFIENLKNKLIRLKVVIFMVRLISIVRF